MNNTLYHRDLLAKISAILAGSGNQELIYHSQHTVQWTGILLSGAEDATVRTIAPEDKNMQIAAFAHEIERALPNSLHPRDFQSYALYKQASQIKSSEILENIMQGLETPQEILDETTQLMRSVATDDRANYKAVILREADVLSFFSLSLPSFFIQKISDKLLQEICTCEFKKLTPRAYKHLGRFNFTDIRLKYYVGNMLKECVVQ